MPGRPKYALRCARLCFDRRGVPRDGDQWIHIHGSSYWVCDPCAEQMGRVFGIPTRSQVRRATREREASQQLPLEQALLAAQAEEALEGSE